MSRILVIGGYGNFGSVISETLAKDPDLKIIVAGRSEEKAKAHAQIIGADYAAVDIARDLDDVFLRLKPDILIHTSGPFQGQSYDVARACIRHKCHYIDLADGRTFVRDITALDQQAKEAGICLISGASSVPGLTSAIIDKYMRETGPPVSLDYAIATAQRTNAGLATTTAILGYAGKPFETLCNGKIRTIYGWQSLTARKYPELGYRVLANCDIPDLTLFPERYPTLKNIRFRAGLEVPFLHLGLWSLSWLVRLGLVRTLAPLAPFFQNIADYFDIFGTERSAFHMEIKGTLKKMTFYLLTDSGHGPKIPCIPSILLARKIARKQAMPTGATSCMGLVTLDEYLEALKSYDIQCQLKSG